MLSQLLALPAGFSVQTTVYGLFNSSTKTLVLRQRVTNLLLVVPPVLLKASVLNGFCVKLTPTRKAQAVCLLGLVSSTTQS
jgi:hypothetical protein